MESRTCKDMQGPLGPGLGRTRKVLVDVHKVEAEWGKFILLPLIRGWGGWVGGVGGLAAGLSVGRHWTPGDF